MSASDKINRISNAYRLAYIRAIIKYSGGKYVGASRGISPNTTVAANETILNSHFTRTNSKRYPPLSEKYAKWKRKKFGNKPILVRTGKMKKSLVAKAKIIPKGRDAFRVTFPDAASYAKYQNLMPSMGNGRHPTRPNNDDLRRFKKALESELATALRFAIRQQ